MIILVAVGAGFIGAAVVRYAINETEDVVFNAGKRTYAGKLGSLLFVAASNRYRFAQADICDQKWMEGIFAESKSGVGMLCDGRSPSLHNGIDLAQVKQETPA